MIRRTGYLFITAALLFAGTLPVAWAQATRLVQGRVRRIKACVAIIPSMGEPQPSGSQNPYANPGNPPPSDPDAVNPVRSPGRYQYLFQVLNQRKDLKPDNWQFYNPAAPAYVTGQQATRWAPALNVGTPLTTSNAAYWEVLLNQSNYDALSQMDVIYLPICRRATGMNSESGIPTFFTEEQRHVLAKLIDSGVTLWMDWAVNGPTLDEALGGKDAANATPLQRLKDPFFTNVDFAGVNNTAATDPVIGGNLIRHPLLNDPFVFQSGEPSAIGAPYAGNAASLQRALYTRVASVEQTTNFEVVVPTVTGTAQNGLAYIAAARYGAGRIVVSAGNVGGAIAGMIPDNTPTINSSTIDFSVARTESLKFAYNVAQWSSEVTAQQKNGRHTGQGNPQINGLFESSSYPYLAPPGGGSLVSYPYVGSQPNYPANFVSPLIINNTIIAATNYLLPGGSTVFELNVFDQNPANDFDQNGYTDDPVDQTASPTNPLVDFSIGQPYDRIMTAPLTAAVTGLTYGEVPDLTTNSVSRGYVFAASANGMFSLPAPRQGMPVAEYWSGATVSAAPNVPQLGNVGFVSAPGFAVLPGVIQANPPPNTVFTSRSQLYGGGVVASTPFGGGAYGKIVAYDVQPNGAKAAMTPSWYYPSTQESNQMGVPSGPVVAAKLEDLGTRAIDTMVLATTVSTGDAGAASQGPAGGGDSTGKVIGIIVATEGDPLVFPKGNTAPNGNNPGNGSTFVCARWIDIPPGVGQVPQARDLMWDPSKQYEVRVMDLKQNYVLCRFVPGTPGFSILQNGTAGQIQLPPPTGQYSGFAKPNRPDTWDLDRYAILADYSPMPQPADQGGLTVRPRFNPATPYVRNLQQTSVPTGIAGVSVGKDNLIYYGTGQGYMCAVENRRGRPQFRVKYRSLEYTDGVGLSTNVDPSKPNYLSDYVFTAPPAAGDRVVFASKSLGSQGTVYVFEPDPVIRFRLDLTNVNPMLLPLDAKKAQEIMIEADHGLGFNPNATFLRATQQPWGRVPDQFSVDPDTATVTFQNMENYSLDLRAARSPQELANATALGIDTDGDGQPGPNVDTGGRPAVPIRWKFLSEQPNQAHTTWIPLPLVAVYRSPDQERWLSGPVISGDRIYLMGDSGILHQLPLDPRTLDPTFPRRFDLAGNAVLGLKGFDMGNTAIYPGGLRKERNVASGLLPARTYHASPSVTDNMVAVSSTRGLTVFSSPSIVVADANRIVEASGDSTAIANTDVVTKYRTDNSDFAIPTDPSVTNTGNRPIFTERRMLNRPAVVRKLNRNSSLTSIFASSNVTLPPSDKPNVGITERSGLANESYLVADTGNNRVVEFNPAGQVIGEWADFYDPFGLLPAGETLKMSGPMDVQRWIEYENAPGLGTLTDIHTLIADTGNTRVIELIDKVLPQAGGSFNPGSYPIINSQTDASGQPIRWYHVLVWSTQTNAQGLKLRYRNAQRIFWTDKTGTPIPAAQDGQSLTHFPYLPDEQYLSYTMATVSGATISYPGTPVPQDLFQFYGGTVPQGVLDRKPDIRGGSDSIVFLRGRYKIDEGTGSATPALVPYVREARQNLATADNYRFSQGIIDPNVPIFTTIYDEVLTANGSGFQPVSDSPVHMLNGVASVQRTVRSDAKFQPDNYQNSGGQPMLRVPYILIADTDGVWEVRMVPNPGNHPQYRLSLAFTVEDYAYCTGAGNGDPTKLYTGSPTDNTPGGRRLSAVSARRVPTGQILVTSRTAGNDVPNVAAAGFQNLNSGPDVFLLRPIDYRTAFERNKLGLKGPYDRYNLVDGSGNPLHGWQPDLWVQQLAGCPPTLKGAASIRWHAADQLNATSPPSLRTQLQFGPNPNELTGTYNPVQPNYADVVF